MIRALLLALGAATLVVTTGTVDAQMGGAIGASSGAVSNGLARTNINYPGSAITTSILVNCTDASFSTYLGYAESNSKIQALSFQCNLATMNSASGTYLWNTGGNNLTAALSGMKTAGKKVMIEVEGWGAPGTVTPTYINAACTHIGGSSTQTGWCEPWDATFLADYSTYLSALNTYISSNSYTSTVAGISPGVPAAETQLNGPGGCPWAGGATYSAATYASAWQTAVGNMNSSAASSQIAFFSPPTSNNICGAAGDTAIFHDDMQNYCKGNASSLVCTAFGADLRAPDSTQDGPTGSGRMKSQIAYYQAQGYAYSGLLPMAFQFVSPATNPAFYNAAKNSPPNILNAVCAAMNAGATWIDWYPGDIQQAIISSNHPWIDALNADNTPSLCAGVT